MRVDKNNFSVIDQEYSASFKISVDDSPWLAENILQSLDVKSFDLFSRNMEREYLENKKNI